MGSEEFYIIADDGDGKDLCRVSYDLTSVSERTDCAVCDWAYDVQVSNVQIITDTHEQAVLIPKQAVVYDGGDKFVFAVDDTAAVRIELQAGFEDADHIESLTEIEPGDQIIIVGQNGLKDKARVRVVNMEPVPQTSAGLDGADGG